MGLRRLARKGTLSISLESVPAGHYTARLELAGARTATAEGTATGGRLILKPRLGRSARARLARMRRGTLVITLACTTGSGEHAFAHQRVKLHR